MKTKYHISIMIVLVVTLLALAVTGCSKNTTDENLDLLDLKTGSIYGYKGIEWKDSKDEVEKSLKFSFEEDKIVNQSENVFFCYNSKPIKLFDIEGTQWFEFKNDELLLVGFDFRNSDKNGDLSNFFEKTLNELTKHYGDFQDDITKENEFGLMCGYKWLNENVDGGRDTLQLISFTKDKDVQIILTVGYIPSN
ncbi:hypothetical protein [Murimonas intestini]|uniref:hypothetical protein n=1 Tax=Murimonas intestini TaxID=1337051 RepID=UPI0011DD421A|nr:hypothetical protein [Murimonas intestini]